MPESSPNESPDPASDADTRPGRVRTWWHPLFARTLAWLLQGGYEVVEEVSVGTLPLRIDLLLIRKASGQVADWARLNLPELFPRLRERTIIEFKSPSDSL